MSYFDAMRPLLPKSKKMADATDVLRINHKEMAGIRSSVCATAAELAMVFRQHEQNTSELRQAREKAYAMEKPPAGRRTVADGWPGF